MCETKKSTNVKMIDFGLATKLNPDEIVNVTTATAEFAAPEIVDSEPIRFYTDMWAVGVLAYVLWVFILLSLPLPGNKWLFFVVCNIHVAVLTNQQVSCL